MAATKMTQSQLIKELAAAVEVPNKTAKAFTVAYAELAIKETKKNGVSVLPGIGRLVRVDRKARIGRNSSGPIATAPRPKPTSAAHGRRTAPLSAGRRMSDTALADPPWRRAV